MGEGGKTVDKCTGIPSYRVPSNYLGRVPTTNEIKRLLREERETPSKRGTQRLENRFTRSCNICVNMEGRDREEETAESRAHKMDTRWKVRLRRIDGDGINGG